MDSMGSEKILAQVSANLEIKLPQVKRGENQNIQYTNPGKWTAGT